MAYTLEDMCIAAIEEVVLDHNDAMTLSSKRMQREEYWYRELCTVLDLMTMLKELEMHPV